MHANEGVNHLYKSAHNNASLIYLHNAWVKNQFHSRLAHSRKKAREFLAEVKVCQYTIKFCEVRLRGVFMVVLTVWELQIDISCIWNHLNKMDGFAGVELLPTK